MWGPHSDPTFELVVAFEFCGWLSDSHVEFCFWGQALGYTMQRSRRELGMLVLFLGIAVLSFSSLMYYAEKGPENKFFTSIPATFWWALITMTTVGCATPPLHLKLEAHYWSLVIPVVENCWRPCSYGDHVPVTSWGRIIGGICCIFGILGVS